MACKDYKYPILLNWNLIPITDHFSHSSFWKITHTVNVSSFDSFVRLFLRVSTIFTIRPKSYFSTNRDLMIKTLRKFFRYRSSYGFLGGNFLKSFIYSVQIRINFMKNKPWIYPIVHFHNTHVQKLDSCLTFFIQSLTFHFKLKKGRTLLLKKLSTCWGLKQVYCLPVPNLVFLQFTFVNQINEQWENKTVWTPPMKMLGNNTLNPKIN